MVAGQLTNKILRDFFTFKTEKNLRFRKHLYNKIVYPSIQYMHLHINKNYDLIKVGIRENGRRNIWKNLQKFRRISALE
jgi:hypothetical protein